MGKLTKLQETQRDLQIALDRHILAELKRQNLPVTKYPDLLREKAQSDQVVKDAVRAVYEK